MKLHVGERLHGTGPAQQPGGYLVTDVVRETPWYGLYTAKKILYNFDFTAKRIRETDAKEWLDVYLRTLHYPRLDDPSDVSQRRALARSEVTILGNRGSNLWPEPIDLLEIENTRDAFAFAPDQDDREPIVVFARPDGQPLGDWQQSAVPVASLLSVLAELLEFIRQAHSEGLLLQGLGPAAILIDRADRVHYIGSDMVADAKEFVRLRRLFPAERYPRGFAAPEFFEPGQAPSPRSDLYAWGTLAYFLFTGHMPWQIALDQGRPWAHFEESHFERLEKSLRQIPPAHLRAWAEQLGLDPEALLKDWPSNCVALFRCLLDPEPLRRPPSAELVRTWMLALPPAPPAAALAIDVGAGRTHLHLDLRGVEPGTEIEIRRLLGEPPRQPTDGALAYAGHAQPLIDDQEAPLSEEPCFYAVFARRVTPSGTLYSTGVGCRALEPTSEHLLALAEADATTAESSAMPPRIALCFRALEAVGLAGTFLSAQRPLVRRWALERLHAILLEKPAPEAEAIVRTALRDADPELRLHAAEILWPLSDRSDVTLLRLLQEMGSNDLDDMIAEAHALQGHAIPDDELGRIVEHLEGERPTVCPLCEIPLPRRERLEHLRNVHDYVEVEGSMLPRRRAEARLWERVFAAGDAQAHRQLMELYDGHGSNGQAYADALHAQLEERPGLDEPDGAGNVESAAWKRWEPWLACVRTALGTHPVLPRLLHSPADRIRSVGRALVLPRLGQRLRGAEVQEVRRVLDELLPGPSWLGERIRFCAELPQVGVDPAKAGACEALFRDELPVGCPECAAQVRAVDLELHLRRLHGIFQFRGVRRSYADTRDVLLAAVCGPRPDVQAWRALVGLAQDRHGTAADERLTMWLCHKIKSSARDERNRTAANAADAIARTDLASGLAWILLGDAVQPVWKNVARQLALEIVAHLEEPLPEPLWGRVRPYLAAKDVPLETRQRTVTGLLRVPQTNAARAREILETFVSATSKHRAVDRLRELEQQIGQSPALEKFIAELEDRIRMTCPRCQLELERHEMFGHLWEKHRLVLEGRRVREPWRVLADWVVDYSLEKDQALLERCRELARRADPSDGLTQLQRLLLRHGVEDPEASNALLSKVRQRGASLCPHCFGQVPLPVVAPPVPLGGAERLEGHGFTIAIGESGVRPHLQITGPDGEMYDDVEPGSWLTRVGALIVLAGPVVLAAVGFIYGLLGASSPGVLIALVGISLGLFLGGLVYYFWPERRLRPRLLDAAWHLVVPELIAETPLKAAAREFIGSLATTSVGHFVPDDEVLSSTITAIQRDEENPTALIPLWRLEEQIVEKRRRDPAPLVAERLGQVLAGQVAARLVAPLIADVSERWARGRMMRLQALLVERTGKLGLDVADLVELGRSQPVLAAALGTGDPDRLRQLQLLDRLLTKPTQFLEQADTIFDLARDPASEKTLAERSDLLLASRSAPIYAGSRGVWLKDICINDMPAQVDVATARSQAGDGFEIVVGGQRVWFFVNPNTIADELEKWLAFYFHEFQGQLTKAVPPAPRDAARHLWAANATPCPECRRPVTPIGGEIGLRLEEQSSVR